MADRKNDVLLPGKGCRHRLQIHIGKCLCIESETQKLMLNIRCDSCAQAVRYAALLLDIAAQRAEPFDELIIEKKFTHFWLHFAVRPTNNRLKVTCLSDGI